MESSDVLSELLVNITFAALNRILPSLEESMIEDVRMLPFPRPTEEEKKAGSGHLPFCIVTLKDQHLVHRIKRAKRFMVGNYFTTGDINSSLPLPGSAACKPDRKVLIN